MVGRRRSRRRTAGQCIGRLVPVRPRSVSVLPGPPTRAGQPARFHRSGAPGRGERELVDRTACQPARTLGRVCINSPDPGTFPRRMPQGWEQGVENRKGHGPWLKRHYGPSWLGQDIAGWSPLNVSGTLHEPSHRSKQNLAEIAQDLRRGAFLFRHPILVFRCGPCPGVSVQPRRPPSLIAPFPSRFPRCRGVRAS